MGQVISLPNFPERRRPSAGEERRSTILAAIEDLLRERPLAAINVGDITNAAGVGRSAFYFYFASKGAAVSALMSRVFTEINAGSGDYLTGRDDPVSGIRSAMEGAWRTWHQHQSLILAMLDARGSDPAIQELWEAWIGRFVDPVAATIDAHRRSGRAIDGADARMLATALVGANEKMFERLSRSGASDGQVRTAIDALMTLWGSAIYGRQ